MVGLLYQNVMLGVARFGDGVQGLYSKVGSDVKFFLGLK